MLSAVTSPRQLTGISWARAGAGGDADRDRAGGGERHGPDQSGHDKSPSFCALRHPLWLNPARHPDGAVTALPTLYFLVRQGRNYPYSRNREVDSCSLLGFAPPRHDAPRSATARENDGSLYSSFHLCSNGRMSGNAVSKRIPRRIGAAARAEFLAGLRRGERREDAASTRRPGRSTSPTSPRPATPGRPPQRRASPNRPSPSTAAPIPPSPRRTTRRSPKPMSGSRRRRSACGSRRRKGSAPDAMVLLDKEIAGARPAHTAAAAAGYRKEQEGAW